MTKAIMGEVLDKGVCPPLLPSPLPNDCNDMWGGSWSSHHKPLNTNHIKKKKVAETSLVVQQLRLRTPNAGDSGLITGQGTRSHMPQLKILHVATKAPHRQIEKKKSCKTERA